jgi:hypothetical protein
MTYSYHSLAWQEILPPHPGMWFRKVSLTERELCRLYLRLTLGLNVVKAFWEKIQLYVLLQYFFFLMWEGLTKESDDRNNPLIRG